MSADFQIQVSVDDVDDGLTWLTQHMAHLLAEPVVSGAASGEVHGEHTGQAEMNSVRPVTAPDTGLDAIIAALIG